jgi:hypothetical protein
MNRFSSRLGVFALAMGISIYGWTANPCRPIAQACMQLGYYKGGAKVGKGLIENCVIPVVNNNKVLSNASFTPSVLQQCNALITAKMQNR